MGGGSIANAVDRLFGSAEKERLVQAIHETRSDFDEQIDRSSEGARESAWAKAADRNLNDAAQKLALGRLQQGWLSISAAQRAILANPENRKRIELVAISLRREADKLSGWRAKAISDLLCGPKGELRPDIAEDPERVIRAVELKDDYSHNNYFKIALRRRHLRQLLGILCLAIVVCMAASYEDLLPDSYNNTKQLGLVILFGVLGACISVGQGLLSSQVSVKIPAQQIGAFVIWMRPAIGAAAALAALAVIDANKAVNILNLHDQQWSNVVGLLALAAGYSERFIVGAIEKLWSAAE